MALDFKDIFGSKAREEIERLKLEFDRKLSDLAREKEVQEKSYKAYIASINASGKSKLEYDAKTDEYNAKIRQLNDHYTEKKDKVTKELEQTELQSQALKSELADLINKSDTLNKTITDFQQQEQKYLSERETWIAYRKNCEKLLEEFGITRNNLEDEIYRLKNVQQAITNGNSHLYENASHINRHAEPDKAFSVLEYELIRLVEEDRKSGAMQFNLEMKPLCLVVDVGLKSTAFALARLMQSGTGEVLCNLEAKQMSTWGAQQSELLLTGWVKNKIASAHPSSWNDFTVSNQITSISQRLLTLLLMNAPFGEIEETIIIDSQQIHVILPFTRDEIIQLFMPLTGPHSDLPKTIKAFLKNKKVNAGELDRIVCLGMYSRLPLLQDSLKEVFGRQVVLGDTLVIAGNEQAKNEVKVPSKATETKSSIQNCIFPQRASQEEQLIFTDSQTGLMWTRNGNIASREMNWLEAMIWVKNLNYERYSDWRLPSKEELASFAKRGGSHPSVWFNSNGFSNVQAGWYWSSTEFVNISAWLVNMGDGLVNDYNKGLSGCVWPVRSGQ